MPKLHCLQVIRTSITTVLIKVPIRSVLITAKNVLNGDLCSGDNVDTYRVNHVDCNCNVCLQNKYVQLENIRV